MGRPRGRRAVTRDARTPARHAPGVAALAGLMLLLVAGEAPALRCGNELIDEGDYSYEVRRACGEPDAIQPLGSARHRDYRPSEEIWYYDLGSNRFLRALYFREGRLRRIETERRGGGDATADGDCRPQEIVAGMSSYRLLRACGEPVQRERRYVARKPSPERYPHLVEDVLVEEWIYEFGETYLPRLVVLEDGEVVRVDTRP